MGPSRSSHALLTFSGNVAITFLLYNSKSANKVRA
jgi:hypothetical protein